MNNSKTDNELIALFMGMNLVKNIHHETNSPTYVKSINGGVVYMTRDMLKYDASWDWLMPAVKAWNDLVISKRTEKSGWTKWQYKTVMFRTDIEPLFNDLVKSIKWYNTQKKES